MMAAIQWRAAAQRQGQPRRKPVVRHERRAVGVGCTTWLGSLSSRVGTRNGHLTIVPLLVWPRRLARRRVTRLSWLSITDFVVTRTGPTPRFAAAESRGDERDHQSAGCGRTGAAACCPFGWVRTANCG
ncbi:MAG: hypothetical protein JOZ57_11150 [Abitibacteriaceae bacterium]|nr:hypothetical protein [Abditibacteriaceae bacterium]